MFAIIKTGGKQYKVSPGHVLHLEKLEGESGSVLQFEEILMVNEGQASTIGAPFLDKAAVKATIVSQGRGEKVLIYKRKRRKGYRRNAGHRQYLTQVHIDEILMGGKSVAKADGKALKRALDLAAEKALKMPPAQEKESKAAQPAVKKAAAPKAEKAAPKKAEAGEAKEAKKTRKKTEK